MAIFFHSKMIRFQWFPMIRGKPPMSGKTEEVLWSWGLPPGGFLKWCPKSRKTFRIETYWNLSGWWFQSLWKIMEFVNGKDDIPYMKWNIKLYKIHVWNLATSYGFGVPPFSETPEIPIYHTGRSQRGHGSSGQSPHIGRWERLVICDVATDTSPFLVAKTSTTKNEVITNILRKKWCCGSVQKSHPKSPHVLCVCHLTLW